MRAMSTRCTLPHRHICIPSISRWRSPPASTYSWRSPRASTWPAASGFSRLRRKPTKPNEFPSISNRDTESITGRRTTASNRVSSARSAWYGQRGSAADFLLRSGHPANEEKVRNWLYYREHSGDIIVEQNCHNLDVVNWFTGTHPTKVSGYGARAVRKATGQHSR